MAAVDIPRWMWAFADDQPFSTPPDGVVPNFEHPQLVHYHSLTIACSISFFLLFIFSGIRLYTKLYIIRKRTIDDYFFWTALPMLLVVESLIIYLDTHGAYGYHAWDIKIRILTKTILVVTFLVQILLQFTIWLIKATLLFLIISVFDSVTSLRRLCYGGIITTLAFYTANLVVQIWSCRPRGGVDRISYLAGMASVQCAGSNASIQKMSITSGVFGVLSDIYILVIPLPVIAQLHISKRQKMGVYLIFASGALACIASILSLVFRVQAWGTKDTTVAAIPSMTAQMVELNVGLMITCVASISKCARYHFATRFPNLFGGSTARESEAMNDMQPLPRRRHAPGGLSELDSMKTFGTNITAGQSHDSESLKNLSAHASPM